MFLPGALLALLLALPPSAEPVRQGPVWRDPVWRDPVHVFATQPGHRASDTRRGPEPGSPFGSAFAEALARGQNLEALLREVAALTRERSRPRGQAIALPPVIPRWSPRQAEERRVALVLVVSDYRHHRDLAGARHDARAVADALQSAGFATTRVLDPAAASLDAMLEAFAAQSAGADVAAIFASGHGLAVAGVEFLLLPEAPARPGRHDLRPAVAVGLPRLAAAARARRLNLILYGGCRQDARAEPLR